MRRLEAGAELDGFRIEECLHAGAMARIFAVTYADGRPSPFPMVMKVPHMGAGDGSENIVGFEIEHQLLQVLQGPHVPRFVAAGDLSRLPYIVMERVNGQTLEAWMQTFADAHRPIPVAAIADMGARLAQAVHSLHQQNTCHLDLKPANAIIDEQGRIVLIDFGLSCHSDYPDLLAEELRKAVGSPAWIAPEQIVGVRGDPRSDVFAIGVMLYEMATGKLPFGAPQTRGGMRQRLWMSPRPPRAYLTYRSDLPEWLQEIILRCLEPQADQRYPSAAHLMFDLHNPDQVKITSRGRETRVRGFWWHFRQWLRAAGMHYEPSPLPSQQIMQVPIVMVALPNEDVSDLAMYALRQATARSLGTRPGARLAVVTVVNPAIAAIGASNSSGGETGRRLQHLTSFRKWAQGLDLSLHQASFHVLESTDVAQALLRYAAGNQVSLIIMGAATHGLPMQRFVATVPIKVAMNAPCTVILVKEPVPLTMVERDVAGSEELADTYQSG
ncbi:serine/threonine protein kinase [Lacisediminimonas profundi]|uniref:serine/threonine protein kinase n=1 Tax=Lacisediminimonas profundi TaxID=2603856 RepID=UPI00124B63E0|nr:bifunctional serine/threonine-protein kinase/universal stress protein [Lacisediminimonas profundi]